MKCPRHMHMPLRTPRGCLHIDSPSAGSGLLSFGVSHTAAKRKQPCRSPLMGKILLGRRSFLTSACEQTTGVAQTFSAYRHAGLSRGTSASTMAGVSMSHSAMAPLTRGISGRPARPHRRPEHHKHDGQIYKPEPFPPFGRETALRVRGLTKTEEKERIISHTGGSTDSRPELCHKSWCHR